MCIDLLYFIWKVTEHVGFKMDKYCKLELWIGNFEEYILSEWIYYGILFNIEAEYIVCSHVLTQENIK